MTPEDVLYRFHIRSLAFAEELATCGTPAVLLALPQMSEYPRGRR